MEFVDVNTKNKEQKVLRYPMNIHDFEMDLSGQFAPKNETLKNSFHSCVVGGYRFFIDLCPQKSPNKTSYTIKCRIDSLPFSAEGQEKRSRILNYISDLKISGVDNIFLDSKNMINFKCSSEVKDYMMIDDFVYEILKIYQGFFLHFNLIKSIRVGSA